MAAELIWDNAEKTILRQVYGTSLTAQDVKDTARQTFELLSTVPHIVHLIIEMQTLTKVARANFVEAARTLDQTVAPNQGLVVAINASVTMQLMAKSASLTAPKATKNVRTAATLEEARDLIAQESAKKP